MKLCISSQFVFSIMVHHAVILLDVTNHCNQTMSMMNDDKMALVVVTSYAKHCTINMMNDDKMALVAVTSYAIHCTMSMFPLGNLSLCVFQQYA